MKKATNIIEVYENINENIWEDDILNLYKNEINKIVDFFQNKKDGKSNFYIFGDNNSKKSNFIEYFTFNNSFKYLELDSYDTLVDMFDKYIPAENTISNILKIIAKNISICTIQELNEIILLKKDLDSQIKLVNEIINENYKYDFVIIDKINNTSDIVLEQLSYLEKLNIQCVVTLPYKAKDYVSLNNNFIELKVTTEILEKVIFQRIEENLITKRALNLAIKYCDNNIEKLLQIIHKASKEALHNDIETIETAEIEKVVNPEKDKKTKEKVVSKEVDKNKYINNIRIKNYFSIDKIQLNNLEDKKEIYFVGENGDGKTIVLQAFALACKDKDNLPILASEYIKEIRNEYDLYIMEEYKYINDNLFAYGINRNKTDADDKDTSGYSGLFDTSTKNATTTLNRPQDLFILNTELTNEFKEKIENLLENKVTIEQNGIKTNFYESGKIIDFKVLSEGYKSTIIWLSDLVSRLIENQPEVTKIKDFKAVVLVDEIDLYLHPKWRYKFVYNLRKIFPNIQFIMTTHSPTTILGASKDAVFYNVYKDENGYTQLTEQYDDISDYSANILITSPLFNMDSAKARSYNNKVNNLSEDDYKKYQLNKKIDKMLEADDDISAKEAILKQLEEYNERN